MTRFVTKEKEMNKIIDNLSLIAKKYEYLVIEKEDLVDINLL